MSLRYIRFSIAFLIYSISFLIASFYLNNSSCSSIAHFDIAVDISDICNFSLYISTLISAFLLDYEFSAYLYRIKFRKIQHLWCCVSSRDHRKFPEQLNLYE